MDSPKNQGWEFGSGYLPSKRQCPPPPTHTPLEGGGAVKVVVGNWEKRGEEREGKAGGFGGGSWDWRERSESYFNPAPGLY